MKELIINILNLNVFLESCCYVYFEVRDARGAWVRAPSSMTLVDLVLKHSEIRIGDPKLALINKQNKEIQIRFENYPEITDIRLNSIKTRLEQKILNKIGLVDFDSIILEFSQIENEINLGRKSESSLILGFGILDSIECKIDNHIEVVNGREMILEYISMHELTHFEVDPIIEKISDSLDLSKPDHEIRMKMGNLLNEFLVDAKLFRENQNDKLLFENKIVQYKLLLTQLNWWYNGQTKLNLYGVIRLIQDVALYSHCLNQLKMNPNEDPYFLKLKSYLMNCVKSMESELQDDLMEMFTQYREYLNVFLQSKISIEKFMQLQNSEGLNFFKFFDIEITQNDIYEVEIV